MLLVYKSKEVVLMLLSRLNATEQELSSFTVEEFKVHRNLVKADNFSLMPWQ